MPAAAATAAGAASRGAPAAVAGSWSCVVCEKTNRPTDSACPGCDTPKERSIGFMSAPTVAAARGLPSTTASAAIDKENYGPNAQNRIPAAASTNAANAIIKPTSTAPAATSTAVKPKIVINVAEMKIPEWRPPTASANATTNGGAVTPTVSPPTATAGTTATAAATAVDGFNTPNAKHKVQSLRAAGAANSTAPSTPSAVPAVLTASYPPPGQSTARHHTPHHRQPHHSPPSASKTLSAASAIGATPTLALPASSVSMRPALAPVATAVNSQIPSTPQSTTKPFVASAATSSTATTATALSTANGSLTNTSKKRHFGSLSGFGGAARVVAATPSTATPMATATNTTAPTTESAHITAPTTAANADPTDLIELPAKLKALTTATATVSPPTAVAPLAAAPVPAPIDDLTLHMPVQTTAATVAPTPKVAANNQAPASTPAQPKPVAAPSSRPVAPATATAATPLVATFAARPSVPVMSAPASIPAVAAAAKPRFSVTNIGSASIPIAAPAPIAAAASALRSGPASAPALTPAPIAVAIREGDILNLKAGDTVYQNRNAFTVQRQLGVGGFSRVYLVCDTKNTPYALKVVSLSSPTAPRVSELEDEIRLLRLFEGDANCIQFIGSEHRRDPDCYTILMEAGQQTLIDSLDEIARDDRRLRDVWRMMLLCIQSVHKHNIVHCDIKPQNFVLGYDKRVKIIDFGIAKQVDENRTSVINARPVGTLNFMPPEALLGITEEGESKSRYASDVWSLGCILYRMVYGIGVWDHIQGGNSDVLRIVAIQNDSYAIAFPEEVTPKVSGDAKTKPAPVSVDPYLIDTMKQCLTRDSKQRPTIEKLLAHPLLYSLSYTGEGDIRHLKPGDTIYQNGAAYTVKKQLGTGGFSSVYLIGTSAGAEQYALKVIDLRPKANDPQAGPPPTLAEIRKEIAILEAVKNEATCIHYFGGEHRRDVECFTIRMEAGQQTLAESLDDTRDELKLRVVWRMMLECVKSCEDKNTIHLDLKPQNFVWTSDRRLKLIDFGIAQQVDDGATSVLNLKLIGTVNYMAPEALQLSNAARAAANQKEPKLRHASDVWSLGCILYRMVYGQGVWDAIPVNKRTSAITDPKIEIKFPQFTDRLYGTGGAKAARTEVDPMIIEVLTHCLKRDPKQRPKLKQLLEHPTLFPSLGFVKAKKEIDQLKAQIEQLKAQLAAAATATTAAAVAGVATPKAGTTPASTAAPAAAAPAPPPSK